MRCIASTYAATVTRVLALAHQHSLRVWIVWGCGVLALAALPISLFDPAVLMLILDPELLAAIVLSCAGLLRAKLAKPSEDTRSADIPSVGKAGR